ncbi:MAG: hypothetical protein QOG87_1464 [Actinomycetota bacterium]
MIARVRHALRLFGATVLGAIVAGAVAGLGARVAMWVIRRMNDSHNGEVTHANAAVGQWTSSGTVEIVVAGALFFGLPGAFLYLLVRRFLPGPLLVRGLLFGAVVLAVGFSGFVQDNEYEYDRYVSPAVSVPLFMALFPLYGVVLVPLAERLGRGSLAPPRRRLVRVGGRVLLLVLLVLGCSDIVSRLQRSF